MRFVFLALVAAAVGCSRKTESVDASPPQPSGPDASVEAEGPKNRALLSAARWDEVTRWTPDYQRRRFIADREVESSGCKGDDVSLCGKGSFLSWCPSAKAASAKLASDEFARKRQQEEVLRLRQECLDKVRKEMGALPALAIVEIGLEPHPYEFETSRFLLQAKGVGVLYEAEFVSPGTAAVTPRDLGATGCDTKGADGIEYGLLTLTGVRAKTVDALERLARPGYTPPSSAKQWFMVALEKPQSQAEAMKPRLDASERLLAEANKKKTKPEDLLRLQLAFVPTAEKKAAVGCNGKVYGVNISTQPDGFVGRAVGFRIVDKLGALSEWTPFGE